MRARTREQLDVNTPVEDQAPLSGLHALGNARAKIVARIPADCRMSTLGRREMSPTLDIGQKADADHAVANGDAFWPFANLRTRESNQNYPWFLQYDKVAQERFAATRAVAVGPTPV